MTLWIGGLPRFALIIRDVRVVYFSRSKTEIAVVIIRDSFPLAGRFLQAAAMLVSASHSPSVSRITMHEGFNDPPSVNAVQRHK